MIAEFENCIERFKNNGKYLFGFCFIYGARVCKNIDVGWGFEVGTNVGAIDGCGGNLIVEVGFTFTRKSNKILLGGVLIRSNLKRMDFLILERVWILK